MNTMDSKSELEKLDILKRKSSYCKRNYSLVSQRLFWDIYNNILNKDGIYFKELNTEYVISGEKTFIYDFLDKINKKIIEFNGDYWHCNPDKYNENYYHRHLKMYAKERWYNDNNRKLITEKYGYQVLVIWESEYRKNPERTLQKCLNFLNN
jgi:very-short-patch-repair endonuclease